jgi:hypothetical protein
MAPARMARRVFMTECSMRRVAVGLLRASALGWILAAGVLPAHGFEEMLADKAAGIDEGREWKEDDTTLPALPTEAGLIEVDVTDASRNRYFIDTASLVVGDDSVTRLTLVVGHRNGRQTVTHEGFRCLTGEYRLYGIGNGEGWDAPRQSPWRPVPVTGYRNVRVELLRNILCDGRSPRQADRVVRDLRYPRLRPN